MMQSVITSVPQQKIMKGSAGYLERNNKKNRIWNCSSQPIWALKSSVFSHLFWATHRRLIPAGRSSSFGAGTHVKVKLNILSFARKSWPKEQTHSWRGQLGECARSKVKNFLREIWETYPKKIFPIGIIFNKICIALAVIARNSCGCIKIVWGLEFIRPMRLVRIFRIRRMYEWMSVLCSC